MPPAPRLPSVAVGVAFAALLALLAAQNNFQDLFIYRAGAAVALRGESPYQSGSVRADLLTQWPDDARLADNAGFFLPPLAIPLYAPFAAVPWGVAKGLYALAAVLAGLSLFRLLDAGPPLMTRVLVPAAVLLNPVTVAGLVVGQTSLLVLGGVVWGEVAWRCGYRRLAGPLWAVAFVKPHLALPLIPLAWYLGGWKRAAELLAWVGGLTALGCLVATGSPTLVRDYLDFLAAGHKQVAFNRAGLNPQVTSWNRLVIGLGGPAVELGAGLTLAGYGAWAGLITATNRRPTAAWATAAAAVGALLCCQVLGYELTLLALVIPHVGELCAAGRRLGWAFVIVLGLTSLPREVAEPVFPSHRSLGVATLAMLLLVGGVTRLAAGRPAVGRPSSASSPSSPAPPPT